MKALQSIYNGSETAVGIYRVVLSLAREGMLMKKVLLLLFAVCLGFALVGCSVSMETVQRSGYSFELKSKWKMEEYEKNSLFFYPDGKGKGASFLHIYEADRSGFPFESLEKQYDSILEFWLADQSYGGGEITEKHSNIEKGTLGGNAFVTADKVTKTFNYTEYARVLCFCPNSETLVVIEFSSMDKKEFDKYKKDVDKLFKSIKLI